MAAKVETLMKEPEEISERIHTLVKIFEQNPNFIAPFRNLIKAMHTQETEIALEEQIRFFTTKHTRNWLLVNCLNHSLNLKELAFDEATGKLPSKPSDILKYAHLAREAFGEESRYRDYAFSIGLWFDYIFQLQRTPILGFNTGKFDDLIEENFLKGIEQGKVITKLSRHKGKLSLEELCPITALIRQLSQIILVVLNPENGPAFYEKTLPQKNTEPLLLALEEKAFGIHSARVGCYLTQSFPVFHHLGEIMSVWGSPYLSWVSHKRDIHDAAGMGELGVLLLESVSPLRFGGAGIVGDTIPELKFLEFELSGAIKNEIKV